MAAAPNESVLPPRSEGSSRKMTVASHVREASCHESRNCERWRSLIVRECHQKMEGSSAAAASSRQHAESEPMRRRSGSRAQGTALGRPMCHAPPGVGRRSRSSSSASTSSSLSAAGRRPEMSASAVWSSASHSQQQPKKWARSPRRFQYSQQQSGSSSLAPAIAEQPAPNLLSVRDFFFSKQV
eukprot:scaffold161746_cov32-Tisochrysis_lutea.AAC.3